MTGSNFKPTPSHAKTMLNAHMAWNGSYASDSPQNWTMMACIEVKWCASDAHSELCAYLHGNLLLDTHSLSNSETEFYLSSILLL